MSHPIMEMSGIGTAYDLALSETVAAEERAGEIKLAAMNQVATSLSLVERTDDLAAFLFSMHGEMPSIYPLQKSALEVRYEELEGLFGANKIGQVFGTKKEGTGMGGSVMMDFFVFSKQIFDEHMANRGNPRSREGFSAVQYGVTEYQESFTGLVVVPAWCRSWSNREANRISQTPYQLAIIQRPNDSLVPGSLEVNDVAFRADLAEWARNHDPSKYGSAILKIADVEKDLNAAIKASAE